KRRRHQSIVSAAAQRVLAMVARAPSGELPGARLTDLDTNSATRSPAARQHLERCPRTPGNFVQPRAIDRGRERRGLATARLLPGTADSDGHGGLGVTGRLREPGEPATFPAAEPPARTGGACFPGSTARSNSPATLGGGLAVGRD